MCYYKRKIEVHFVKSSVGGNAAQRVAGVKGAGAERSLLRGAYAGFRIISVRLSQKSGVLSLIGYLYCQYKYIHRLAFRKPFFLLII